MTDHLLTYQEAYSAVADCEHRNVFIFGIERIILEGELIVPDIDAIADFSSVPEHDIKSAAAASRAYLDNFGTNESERFILVT